MVRALKDAADRKGVSLSQHMTAWALTQCPNSISPVGTTSSEHLQDNINGQKTLWGVGGINRDNGKLTYPTAMNNQDIIIFAFTKSGTYRYNPEGHTLTLIAEGDNRALTGSQPFVAKAAADLLYIQDTGKWEGRPVPAEVVLNCGFAHAGSSMQNVYLYAASQGWGARTRMNFDREGLTKLLSLTEKHNFTLMQCVGPKP